MKAAIVPLLIEVAASALGVVAVTTVASAGVAVGGCVEEIETNGR
jgi:hypothetical protein